MEILNIHQDNLIAMTSRRFALYLACLCLWRTALATNQKLFSSVRQESGFVSANVGDSMTLRCFYESDVAAVFLWYKQILGQEPRLISSFYKHDKKGSFIDELKNNPRFTLETNEGKNHLTISDLRTSDSATYYCIGCYAHMFDFGKGITVSVKGSGQNIPTLIHQSASETIQPGGSVTLNCIVHTGSCDGEHSVYWFKNSEESHSGLIYTHGDRNDQCERKPNSQTHTCVYNLLMENLNRSDAGTYYCAVASCGHILFGEGIKLNLSNFEDEVDLVYFWRGASVFSTILAVLLAFSVCMMNKRHCCQSSESQTRSASSTANSQDYENTDNLYYAALSVKLHKRSRGQSDQTWSECVYYSVKK